MCCKSTLIAVTLFYVMDSVMVKTSSVSRYKRNNGYEEPSPEEIDRLSKVYGRDVLESHKNDFLQVGALGERQQPIFRPHPPPLGLRELNEYRQTEVRDQAHLLQNQPLTPALVKRLLKDLLQRLDSIDLDRNVEDFNGPGASVSTWRGRCSLHGLWISAITGVAFHLEPPPAHRAGPTNTLRVRVIDVGSAVHAPETQTITSQWTGTAQVSSESATTIGIILQEKMLDPDVEPATASFVGQCVVCNGAPTIQGTWILFPKNQICFQEGKPPQSDVMYLLTFK